MTTNEPIDPKLLAKLRNSDTWHIEGPPQTVKKVEEIMADFDASTWSRFMRAVMIDFLTEPNETTPEYTGGIFVERKPNE